MRNDAEMLAMMSRGFRRGAARLEVLRRKEIRESDHVNSIPLFDGLFEMALERAVESAPIPLSPAQRVLFGVDK
jgi:hypothetical protein